MTSELNNDSKILERVTGTVLCFERVIVVALLCVLAVLSICGDEKLTEGILDPTLVSFGAVEEFIFTKVLLSVTKVSLRDMTVVKPLVFRMLVVLFI